MKNIPVIHVSAPSLAESYDKALIALNENGVPFKTQYDKPNDPPSLDCTMNITVLDPLSDPMLHKAFPGGIGNTGSVCGAVIGAVMGIGLVRGRSEDMEEMMQTLAVGQEFRRRFEAEMETIECRELTGIDLTTPEGVEELMSSEVPVTVCFPAVGIAYRVVVDLLRETQ